MKRHVADEIDIRRYLLGELRQEEKVRVEERLFLDREFFQQLHAIEDDLIDDYVDGTLSSEEREKFDEHYLSTPERREDLRISMALRKLASKSTPSNAADLTDEVGGPFSLKKKIAALVHARTPAWSYALLAATLLIALGGVWLVIRVWGLQQRVKQLEAQQVVQQEEKRRLQEQLDRQKEDDAALTKREQEGDLSAKPEARADAGNPVREPDKLNKQGGRTREPAPAAQARGITYAFMLVPGGNVRGEEATASVKLPADAGFAKLGLALIEETDYRSYRATLQRDDGGVLRVWDGLKPSTFKTGKRVVVRMPAGLLSAQRYHLKLSGVSRRGESQDVGTYYFRVEKNR